jgi:F-type H+/Na+-transporting ATPase subunit alpha
MAKLEADKAMSKESEAEMTTAVTAFKKSFA